MSHELSIVVKAPRQQDSDVLQASIENAKKLGHVVCDIQQWSTSADLGNECVLVCTQEGVTKSLLDGLSNHASRQPSWAQLPVVFLLDNDIDTTRLLRALGEAADGILITILHRPIRVVEFVTAIANAIAMRQRQLEIKSHIDYQTELGNELNHRIKNTFATIYALYRASMRQSKKLDEFGQRFEARMNAMMSVQEHLRGAPNQERSVHEIAKTVLRPYRGDGENRIRISGVFHYVSDQPAQALALVLNELATNATKYGALSRQEGNVEVEFSRDAENLLMHWRETGGPLVTVPEETSYGTRFIEANAAGLGGYAKFDYQAQGLQVEIGFSKSSIT